jgi:hypothetical protein
LLIAANAMEFTVQEIAESQLADATMGLLKDQSRYAIQLVKNTMILCYDGKLVIPKDLQDRTVAWYHHYL